MFFAHIDSDGSECLLVSLVNDKTSAALTATYAINEVQHLDLDGYRFAGRIDLTSWQAKEDRYIGFLKGNGGVLDYFKEFLGCSVAIKAVVETESFVDAVLVFAENQRIVGKYRDHFLKKPKIFVRN